MAEVGKFDESRDHPIGAALLVSFERAKRGEKLAALQSGRRDIAPIDPINPPAESQLPSGLPFVNRVLGQDIRPGTLT